MRKRSESASEKVALVMMSAPNSTAIRFVSALVITVCCWFANDVIKLHSRNLPTSYPKWYYGLRDSKICFLLNFKVRLVNS